MHKNKIAFLNCKVYTVNESQPLAEAVVVHDNKIIFVGSNGQARRILDKNTDVIDLEGRLMLPGFIDDHVHLITAGFHLNGVCLRQAKTTLEFREILADYVLKHRGEWITGGSWDHETWALKELPTREMIDDISPDTPIFVERLDGHMALANSYAIKLAGIDKNTVSPDGGLIVKRSDTGEPTGILKDNAMSLIYSIVPPPSEKDVSDACLRSLQEACKNGVTSVHDITYKSDLKAYQRLEKENLLSCRIYTRLPIAEYKEIINGEVKAGYGSEKLKIGSLKAFSDGSLGSSTAWFFDPYTQNPDTTGLAMDIVTDGRLRKWALEADRNGLQLSIHAIGDRANSYVLDLFEEIALSNPEWDRRFRIEHAQHVRFEDISRFNSLKVIASVQPYHCIDDGSWAEKRIGKKRIKYTYPFKSFLNNKVKLCFGTDWPIAPLNPLLGIYAAVTRRTLDEKNPDGWIPEQKLSVEEAIKCYTINSAYASFEENIKGSIEQGKLADMVVLNDDILTIDPVKIKDVKVEMSIFDGKIVYKRARQ